MNIQQYTTLVTFQSNVSFCQARQTLYIMQQYADAVTTKPLELRHQQQFLLVYCNIQNTSPGPAGWLECAL